MDSLKLTLNSQDVDYTKNPLLFFELSRNELKHQFFIYSLVFKEA